ncbi:hypothetical protein JCM10212_004025 [Sporobolomyces blumeae]
MPNNLAFYAIPATWVIGQSCHWYAIWLTLSNKGLPGFDVSDVRSFQAKVATMDRKNPNVGKFVRAEAATSNMYETLPLFAGAVVAGAVARLPLDVQHRFAWTYVALRFVYSLLYINISNRKYAGAGKSFHQAF